MQPRYAGMQYGRFGPGQHTCELPHVPLEEHLGRQGAEVWFRYS
ncbi:hypothetical protein LILAB_34595 [Corallococcus macrosporus]|uniref:Uncharacterized protein n=1 Tax=Myxococcus fulvus (strain ATCC BAA-855 / HW-1) TaxID=483219 RepID=F8CHW7_MYXFH|nr:hypothetical protein LILAB_34595 [Corallococcus macrosporus]